MKLFKSSSYRKNAGFTLIELLVVIAIIAILAAMLLVTLPCPKRRFGRREPIALNNPEQLMLAWRMYAEDNRDDLPYAYATDSDVAPLVWVPGYLDENNLRANDNWNVDNTVKASVLAPYLGKAVSVWHCPADTTFGINPQNQKVAATVTFSMNNYVGGNGNANARPYGNGGWGEGPPRFLLVYRKLSAMQRPGPAMTFVILDERQDSINDAFFVSQMNGYPNIATTYGLVLRQLS